MNKYIFVLIALGLLFNAVCWSHDVEKGSAASQFKDPDNHDDHAKYPHHHHNDDQNNHAHNHEDGKQVRPHPIKIAIVGAGIGGTSCAYYINKILSNSSSSIIPEITIYEKEKVGGRARIVDIEGKHAELGGSIIHPLNENMLNMIKDVGLETVRDEAMSDNYYSFWDGNQVTFSESPYPFVDIIKMLVNYYWDPIRFKNSRNEIVGKFLENYKRVEPFHSVNEFYQQLGLQNTTNQTAADYFFNEVGISKDFVEKVLSTAIRVNYNQHYDEISAFAAYIGLVGTEDGLFAIKGGNYQLPKALIKKSNSKLVTSQVKEIEKIIDANEKTLYKIKTSQDKEGVLYDIVIIATPLELSDGIKLKGLNSKEKIIKRDFRKVHVYLMAADSLNPTFFGLPSTHPPPANIITTHNKSLPFVSVCKNTRGKISDNRTVYKIFAHKELPQSYLDDMFKNHTKLVYHIWSAYPVLKPTNDYPPIQLDENLYYLNAFEQSISTMETETIASKNIAKLIAKSLKRPYGLL
ncbi:hypothetical protein CYY_006703 [Polysphondylium violaceum]|uniref:Prenylcysteine lyase domain-containing protein n=1 Tax=Polysphondylium violaceum TaxID=133409 RepID=A0A8J4PS44_9MYCE|nr:hypothetical protein CYY_006703 [Polysphondylium violaceum]